MAAKAQRDSGADRSKRAPSASVRKESAGDESDEQRAVTVDQQDENDEPQPPRPLMQPVPDISSEVEAMLRQHKPQGDD